MEGEEQEHLVVGGFFAVLALVVGVAGGGAVAVLFLSYLASLVLAGNVSNWHWERRARAKGLVSPHARSRR